MKFGEFRKVPEVIGYTKGHLDRIHSSGFTRGSYLANSYQWLFVLNTTAQHSYCAVVDIPGKDNGECFDASASVGEDAEKLTYYCHRCPLEDDCSATCGLLTTLI